MIQDVKDMNVAFGNPEGDIENVNWEDLRTQIRCIPEEIDETMEAIDEHNVTKLIDGISDICVFAIGAAHKAGFDLEKSMKAVYISNMSKFITDDLLLAQTIAKYNQLGIAVGEAGEYPTKYVFSMFDQYDVNEKFYPKNKFLKSVAFKEPKLI